MRKDDQYNTWAAKNKNHGGLLASWLGSLLCLAECRGLWCDGFGHFKRRTTRGVRPSDAGCANEAAAGRASRQGGNETAAGRKDAVHLNQGSHAVVSLSPIQVKACCCLLLAACSTLNG